MKISKKELRQMINESVREILNEDNNSNYTLTTEQVGMVNRNLLQGILSRLHQLLGLMYSSIYDIRDTFSNVEFKTDKTPFMKDLFDDIKDIRRLQNDLLNVKNTFEEVCRKTPQAFITHPIDNNSSVQQTQTSQKQNNQTQSNS